MAAKKKTLIEKHDLGWFAEELYKNGYSYFEIAEEISKRYKVFVGWKDVQAYFNKIGNELLKQDGKRKKTKAEDLVPEEAFKKYLTQIEASIIELHERGWELLEKEMQRIEERDKAIEKGLEILMSEGKYSAMAELLKEYKRENRSVVTLLNHLLNQVKLVMERLGKLKKTVDLNVGFVGVSNNFSKIIRTTEIKCANCGSTMVEIVKKENASQKLARR